jgi:DNA-binding GntR family transcriptional regulator
MVRRPQLHVSIGKAGSAYEKIRRLAINGELRPDRRLSPNYLTGISNASITPVREALMRLAVEGLIRGEVNRGYFTKRFDVLEQRELHDLITMNLKSSLAWSLRSAPSAFLQGLAVLEDTEANDAETLAALVEQLYDDLAEASGNRLFGAMNRITVDRTHLIRVLDVEQPETAALTKEALRNAAQALLARDSQNAIASVESVLSGRFNRLPALVDRANAKAVRSSFP